MVLIGAGWEHAAEGPEAALKLLRRMPLLKLMPCGYLVIWGSKWTLQALMRWLAPLNFRLVENMGWVRPRVLRSCARAAVALSWGLLHRPGLHTASKLILSSTCKLRALLLPTK